MDKLTITVDETASKLGISRATAYEGIKNNQIPHIRIGGRILVPLAGIEQLVGIQRNEAQDVS